MPEKYQDEIEEILKGIEEQEPPRPARRPQRIIDDMPRAANEETPSYRDQPRGRGAANSRWKHVTPGRVALAGFMFLVLGLALNSLGFGWLVWLGLVEPRRRLPAVLRPPPTGQQGQGLARSLHRIPGALAVAEIQALDGRIARHGCIRLS